MKKRIKKDTRKNLLTIAGIIVFTVLYIVEDSLNYVTLEGGELLCDAGLIGLALSLPIAYYYYKQSILLSEVTTTTRSILSKIRKEASRVVVAIAICFFGFFVTGTIGKLINVLGPKSESRQIQALVEAKKKSDYDFGTAYELTIRWEREQYTLKTTKEKWEFFHVNDDILMTIREGILGYKLAVIDGPAFDKREHVLKPDF